MTPWPDEPVGDADLPLGRARLTLLIDGQRDHGGAVARPYPVLVVVDQMIDGDRIDQALFGQQGLDRLYPERDVRLRFVMAMSGHMSMPSRRWRNHTYRAASGPWPPAR